MPDGTSDQTQPDEPRVRVGDADTEQPEYLGPAELDPRAPAVGRKFDQNRHREIIRNVLAIGVLGLMIFVLVLPMWQVAVGGKDWSELEGMVGATVPGVVGIAGTILGFYFGSRDQSS